MLFIGPLTFPVMLRIASMMATKVSNLRVHHLKDLESLIRYAKRTEPCVLFPAPSTSAAFSLDVFTDAAMTTKNEIAARGGYVIVRRIGNTVHAIHWNTRKLRGVARSSLTAEILSAADALDMALYLRALLTDIFYPHAVNIITDSRSLLYLATSTKEPEEAMNKIDLFTIRHSFENGEINSFCWSPGYYHIADGLTKDNRETAALLKKVLRDGSHPPHPELIIRTSTNRGVEGDAFAEAT